MSKPTFFLLYLNSEKNEINLFRFYMSNVLMFLFVILEFTILVYLFEDNMNQMPFFYLFWYKTKVLVDCLIRRPPRSAAVCSSAEAHSFYGRFLRVIDDCWMESYKTGKCNIVLTPRKLLSLCQQIVSAFSGIKRNGTVQLSKNSLISIWFPSH